MWAHVVLGLAAMGATATSSVTSEVDAGDRWWDDLGVSATLDNYVGIGTFVPSRTADNPYYASWLTVTPTYALGDDIQLGLSLILTYEWTYLVTPCHAASGPRPVGAPSRDCSDTSDRLGRRGDFFDLPLTIRHKRLLELGPFTLSGSARVELPLSRLSRSMGNLFTIGGTTTGRLSLDPAYVSASVSVAKYFPTAEATVLDQAEVEAKSDGGVPAARCASSRGGSCLLLFGFVSSWQMQAYLTAGTSIPWVDGLSTSVTLGYWYVRRYGRAPDQFTSPVTDENGDRVVTGVNHGDLTSGTVDVSYVLGEHVTLSLGLFSLQPARTADGRAMRFPFYDFVSPARNYTAWYVSGSYRL